MRFFRPFSLFSSLLLLTLLFGSAMISPSYASATGSLLNVITDKSAIVELDVPAGTIFIANPEIADVQVISPTRVMVLGKKIGETTLIISDDQGSVLANRTVLVSTDVAELERVLLSISPHDKLTVKAVPNGVILSGEASDTSVVETARRIALRYISKEDGDIINNIKLRANNQIQIKVRFAEVSREVDKRFGIDWENVISSGSFVFGLATGADFLTNATTVTRTSIGGSINDSLHVGYTNGNYSINGMIDALAKEGLVTVLAEPTLTAMSGETASFLAGGEFPIPVPQSADTMSIEWKQYGVSLAFTPTIINGNRINLHVRPEVSQLSEVGSITINNTSVPALTTRRAETTVELVSGQSFAIAGLLNNNQTQAISKFPFLGDMPILGSLFRSTRFQNNESELVIIITPYIVKPSTQEQLALPTDGYKQPTDADMLFKLQQTNKSPKARPMSGETRAVKVKAPTAAEAPAPLASPVLPIEQEMKEIKQIKIIKKLPVSSWVSLPVPKKKTIIPRPPGPGGFIME